MPGCTTTSTEGPDTITPPSTPHLTQQLKQPFRLPQHVRQGWSASRHVPLLWPLQPSQTRTVNDEQIGTGRLPLKQGLSELFKYNKIKVAGPQEQEQRRPTPLLTDKDQHYLRMLEEKQGLKSVDMTSSKVMRENPEYNHEPHQPKINYRLNDNDSLSRELQDFDTIRRWFSLNKILDIFFITHCPKYCSFHLYMRYGMRWCVKV